MNDRPLEGDLEIDQDLPFTHWEWTLQRVGWGVMGFLVMLALLGVFSSGPLSHTTAATADAGLSLHYDRFARYFAPTILRVHMQPAANHNQQARLWFERRYLEGLQIQYIIPQPQRVETAAERFTYLFDLVESEQPTTVTFHLQTNTMGSLSGRIGLDNGPTLSFSQFVYP